MTSRFLLDPRVLDDCVSDSISDVEIEAEGVACFKHPSSGVPGYYFYVDELDKSAIPAPLSKIYHREVSARLMYTLIYQRVHLNFIQLKSPDNQYRQWVLEREFLSGDSKELEVIYAYGDFLKGNADRFKEYGITIL